MKPKPRLLRAEDVTKGPRGQKSRARSLIEYIQHCDKFTTGRTCSEMRKEINAQPQEVVLLALRLTLRELESSRRFDDDADRHAAQHAEKSRRCEIEAWNHLQRISRLETQLRAAGMEPVT